MLHPTPNPEFGPYRFGAGATSCHTPQHDWPRRQAPGLPVYPFAHRPGSIGRSSFPGKNARETECTDRVQDPIPAGARPTPRIVRERTIRLTQDDRSSPRLRHLLTNDDGVPGFGIDPGSDRLTAARYGVCVFLLGDYAVLDDLRGGRRHLAANRGRRSRRRRRRSRSNRLLLGRTAYKAEKQNEPQVSH